MKHEYMTCDVCGTIQRPDTPGGTYWACKIARVTIRVPEDGINGGTIATNDYNGNVDLCEPCRRVIYAAITSAVKELQKASALAKTS
jgi:hypothetical protein